jgi:hypothetical protein
MNDCDQRFDIRAFSMQLSDELDCVIGVVLLP